MIFKNLSEVVSPVFWHSWQCCRKAVALPDFCARTRLHKIATTTVTHKVRSSPGY